MFICFFNFLLAMFYCGYFWFPEGAMVYFRKLLNSKAIKLVVYFRKLLNSSYKIFFFVVIFTVFQPFFSVDERSEDSDIDLDVFCSLFF